MSHRFLLHSLSHTFAVVDISAMVLSTQIYPPDGQRQTVPALRFQSWEDAARYFQGLGVGDEELEKISARLEETSVAILTIV